MVGASTSNNKVSDVSVKLVHSFLARIYDTTGYHIEITLGRSVNVNENSKVTEKLRELIKRNEVTGVDAYRYDRETDRHVQLFSLNSIEATIYLRHDSVSGLDYYMKVGMVFLDDELPFTEFLLDVLDGKLSVRDYLIKSVEYVKDLINTEIQASIPDL